MTSDLLALLAKVNLVFAAAVVLVLLLRRPVRAAFGARSAYALWLIAPLSLLALLIPARTVVQPLEPMRSIAVVQAPAWTTPSAETSIETAGGGSPPPRLPVGEILLGFWLCVALGGLIVQAERQRRFVRSLGKLSPSGGVLWSDRAGVSPAVIGALAPRMVLPADFTQRFTAQEQALILAHEKNHLAVGDAQINAVVTSLQCLFWFNPFVHLCAAVLRVDQEIACDAAVLARHPRTRRAYGEAMLKTQLAPCAPPLGCHWPASANKQLKERCALLAHH
ncbi:MAG TPA: M56 family metallopeptidase, partial [Caulobacter sp.]|nr:M56 family metallopeptidase [Caulobacter sp.]